MQRFHWNYDEQRFQTINGLTRPTVFMPNLKQKPKIMSNPWVKSSPRDGEIQGFDRTSLSPTKRWKAIRKAEQRIIWKPRLTLKYWELYKSKITPIL